MYPSHPVTQNFVPGHILFIQSSVCKTIVELADCDVVQLSESTVELSIYTRMAVMFAYRHAYHTIETSTSILQSGNWANRTVKAKVHSMPKTMIPILSRVCVCVKWLLNSKILYNYAILQCSTCDFIIYVYITTCMYLCIRMQLVCDVSCSEVMFISSFVGLTCSWLLHMILKHMRTTIN